MPKSLTLLTCNEIPEPIAEDRLLILQLESQGIATQLVPWQRLNDPNQLKGTVLIRTAWDYTQHLDEFLRTLRKVVQAGGTLINPLPLVEWNATKTYLRDLEMEGITIPLTFWYDQLDEVSPAMLWPEGSPAKAWVLKPQVSASARGTFLMHSPKDFPIHREAYQQGGWGPLMIQEYLPSVRQEGELSLVFFNQEFSHAVQKIPRHGDFRVQEKFGGFTKAVRPPSEAIGVGNQILQALPHRPLYARVDLLRHPETQRWALIELELIEPQLFLDFDPESVRRLGLALAHC